MDRKIEGRKRKEPCKTSLLTKEKILSTKRHKTLHNKAEQLEKLCNAKVCIVSYDPNGNIKVWPEDEEKAKSIIMEYKEGGSCRKTREVKISDLLGAKIEKLEEEEKKGFQFEGFEHHVDHEKGFAMYDEKSLVDKLSRHRSLIVGFETELQKLDEKIQSVLEGKIILPFNHHAEKDHGGWSIAEFSEPNKYNSDNIMEGQGVAHGQCQSPLTHVELMSAFQKDQITPNRAAFSTLIDPTWPISLGNSHDDSFAVGSIGCGNFGITPDFDYSWWINNFELDNNGVSQTIGTENLGGMRENYRHEIGDLEKSIDNYQVDNYHNPPSLGSSSLDCEAADNLAANFIGFESCAENSNININGIMKPPSPCWPNFWQGSNMSMGVDHQNHDHQHMVDPVHHHHQPIISPLYEAVSSFSFWPQPQQLQMSTAI